jgi:predicted DNA-binding transcriptional regulator AlpA
VVVVENDEKPDGTWPGRDGAERVAGRLSEALGRPVLVTYLPAGFKDVRAFLTADTLAGVPWPDRGARLLAAMAKPATAPGCHPPPPRKPPTKEQLFHDLSDLGNAASFITDHGDGVRYVADWGCWAVFDGVRWTVRKLDPSLAGIVDLLRELVSVSRPQPAMSGLKELARLLDLGTSTVERLKATPEIGPQPVRIGGSPRWERAEFAAWLVAHERVPRDPFAALKKGNPERDRKHVRRALSFEELRTLVAHTRGLATTSGT